MTIFEFKSYIEYLRGALTDNGKRAGVKAALAQYLRCQSSFISQVLAGRCHLSLEHAILVSEFLKHSDDEHRYFLLMVQADRAGSVKLRNFFAQQMQELRSQRSDIGKRIGVKQTVQASFLPIYYANWWYAAIHVLTAFPEYTTENALCDRLNLSKEMVRDALTFLVEAGLVQKESQSYTMTERRIHLDKKSPLISRHHMNWRMKSAQQCEKSRGDDLRYSCIMGISEHDASRMRELILELIAKSETILKESDEEDAFIFLCDFFTL